MTTEYVSGGPGEAKAETAAAPKPWEDGGQEEGDDEVPDWMVEGGVNADMGDPNRTPGQGGLRFWMPKNSQKIIIFLTDGVGKEGPKTIFEHNPPLGSGKRRFQNWISCIEPLGIPCPLCKFADAHDGIGRRYKGMFFTIIDTSEFTNKAGAKVSNLKKLFIAKKDTTEIIARKYLSRVEAGESLKGAMYKVYRKSSDKSPSCGDDFEFMKMVDLASLPDPAQLDYKTLLKPDPAKVQAVFERLKSEYEEFGPNAGDFNAPKQEGAAAAVKY